MYQMDGKFADEFRELREKVLAELVDSDGFEQLPEDRKDRLTTTLEITLELAMESGDQATGPRERLERYDASQKEIKRRLRRWESGIESYQAE